MPGFKCYASPNDYFWRFSRRSGVDVGFEMPETLHNMRRAVDLMKDQLGEDAYKEWKSQLNKLENVIDGLYVQLQDRNGEIAMLRNKLEMKAEVGGSFC